MFGGDFLLLSVPLSGSVFWAVPGEIILRNQATVSHVGTGFLSQGQVCVWEQNGIISAC